ncbi:MAG TPA: hypothetical protein VJT49_12620 [Amycolatopsis sp.]|uniref:hypothetical protein n=1 Tax=Amycolatopsis sp. TaxID=37632 RepID=UPI002B481A9F|nr:hypothetical protein [Amycolatopsis sp.]HKS45932.1 hypothetical protein [Amycolatopsis sp.]
MATKLSVVVLVAALAFAGWAGWSWYRAAHGDAQARDEALDAGKAQVAVLTSFDYHNVDDGITRWLNASTGALHDRLAQTADATKDSLRQGATVATGVVLDAAIAELDMGAGTAKMLVSVEIRKTRDSAAPSTGRNRYLARLSRTPDGWKLASLDTVGVGAS